MTVKTLCAVKCEVLLPVTSNNWSDSQPMELVIREARTAAIRALHEALDRQGGRVVGEPTIVVTMEITKP